jgi:ammonia channel protein AmtB
MGLSPVFIAATGLMLAVCVWLTIRQQLTLKGLDFSQGKLLEVAEKLNKVKVHYHEWIKIALPMLIIWFSWLMYEVITHCGIEEPMTMGFCVGAAIGGVVGGIVGYRTNRKIVRKSTEILEQIDEITRQ